MSFAYVNELNSQSYNHHISVAKTVRLSLKVCSHLSGSLGTLRLHGIVLELSRQVLSRDSFSKHVSGTVALCMTETKIALS